MGFVRPISAAGGVSIWGNTTPPIPASSDAKAYELGVKFRSTVNGYITALRFYKGGTNTGTHIGHLWSRTGTLLASATFTSETASGWQQVTLPKPVAITANTTYIASYWDPHGHYALARPYFTSSHSNPPLTALANGTDGPNAVFLTGVSRFPTQTYKMSNYWVDVVFVPATNVSIWGSTTPPIPASSDAKAYELGVKFRSTVNGYITALRFYKGGTNTGTHIGHLWSRTGTLLASATFTNETASGWQQVTLPKPVAITANTTYIASYWDPHGHYALAHPYFTSSHSNPPLTALANGTDGPNGVFRSGASGFPAQTYQSSNYWVDVGFAPTGSGVGGGSGSATRLLTGSPATLSFRDVTVGSSSTLPLVVTDTGNTNVTVSQAKISGAGFSVHGPSLPLTLAAGQNTSFSVRFAPAVTGSVTGNISVVSSATNSPAVSSLSGAGVKKHSVILSWLPSASSGVVGYNVYRGTISGGPYSKLNSSLKTVTTYTDTTVWAGQTCYYVTTAVNSKGEESAHSNQVRVAVPFP